MKELFARLGLADVHRDVIRNIVSIRESQDLFDDLTDDPAEWALAQQIESEVKPPTYRSHTPVIHRPFEEAAWFNAIEWPFKHWQASRFSDGTFGVWYGSASIEATVYETAYHWYCGLLTDAGFETLPVIGERKLYSVACDAALLDLRPLAAELPRPAAQDRLHLCAISRCPDSPRRSSRHRRAVGPIGHRRELRSLQSGRLVESPQQLPAHL